MGSLHQANTLRKGSTLLNREDTHHKGNRVTLPNSSRHTVRRRIAHIHLSSKAILLLNSNSKHTVNPPTARTLLNRAAIHHLSKVTEPLRPNKATEPHPHSKVTAPPLRKVNMVLLLHNKAILLNNSQATALRLLKATVPPPHPLEAMIRANKSMSI